ncbi:MAG: hypothetical protein QOC64_2278, partial [Solirubrobacteraceae bacterium]|nr:hypothetical protein [Solirubrobacteraceae bacterium]
MLGGVGGVEGDEVGDLRALEVDDPQELAAALAEFGIGEDQVTDPFNVFMNTAVGPSGEMVIRTAPSAP